MLIIKNKNFSKIYSTKNDDIGLHRIDWQKSWSEKIEERNKMK